jgi:hypothetical protein
MFSVDEMPIKVILTEEDNDAIIVWGKQNESDFHALAVEAAMALYKNENMEGIVLVEFFDSPYDLEPWSDIYMEREEILTSLEDAEIYFVSVEEYEKAQWVKNYRDSIV